MICDHSTYNMIDLTDTKLQKNLFGHFNRLSDADYQLADYRVSAVIFK